MVLFSKVVHPAPYLEPSYEGIFKLREIYHLIRKPCGMTAPADPPQSLGFQNQRHSATVVLSSVNTLADVSTDPTQR